MLDKTNLHTVLEQELNASCNMIKLGIENMDDNLWGEQKNEWSYIQNLYHIIQTLEFYSYEGPEDLDKKGSLGINTLNLSKEEKKMRIDGQPKEFFFRYLENAKQLLLEKINSFTTDELFEKDKFHEWGFTSRFHKYSYTLRHTMFHTGELNKELRDLQKTRLKWL